MAAYTPDVVVTLVTLRGSLTVNLVEGGEKFPWAAHQGKVIIGPPDGTQTSDGTPLDSLSCTVSTYWVVEALLNEEVVELSPHEYSIALALAEEEVAYQNYGLSAGPYDA